MTMTFIGRDIRTRPLHDVGLPIPFAADALPGVSVLAEGAIYRSERYPTVGDPFAWVSAAQIARDVASDVLRGIAADILIRVAPLQPEIIGERYQTLGAALSYLSRFQPVYREDWASTNVLRAHVELAAGYVANEQLFFYGVDLSWVTIFSVDGTVTVPASALTLFNIGPLSVYGGHAFIRGVNSSLPTFRGTRFIFDGGTLTADPTQGAYTPRSFGVSLVNSSMELLSAKTDASNVALPATRAAGIEGFHTNVFARSQGRFAMSGAKLNNAIEYGLRYEPGGIGLATNFEITGAGINSIRLAGVTSLFASGAAATGDDIIAGHYDQDFRRTPGVDGATDLVITGGAQATITIATARGGSSIIPWSQLAEGYLADNRFPQTAYLRGIVQPTPYTVGTVPSAAANVGAMIYVINGAAGQPILAFSDGTNWLRCDTRAAISA